MATIVSRRRVAAALGVAVVAASAGGCGLFPIFGKNFHLEHNAPGLVDVHAPPEGGAALKEGHVERPKDPGEHHLTVSPGVATGLHQSITDSSDDVAFVIGPDVALHWSVNDWSHWQDNEGGWPIWSVGVAGGWLFPVGKPNEHVVYTAAFARHLLGGGEVGYAWTPQDGHGVHFGVDLLMFSFQANVYPAADTATFMFLGMFKYPLSFFWSQ
jgi:hypothetical protein